MIWLVLIIAFIIIFFLFQFSILVPSVKGLPVLLYHKVSEAAKDELTITAHQLEEQFKYLITENYTSITSNDVIKYLEEKKSFPENPVLITFDDGYVNNLEMAYPLLKKYGMRATIFLPTKYLGGESGWESNPSPIMSESQLKSLDAEIIEFALHSHNHTNYNRLDILEIENDLKENIKTLKNLQLPFSHAFAYPYGGRPKNRELSESMKKIMKGLNIKIALRIGNRVNKLPLKNNYEIKRIDIKGTDSLIAFKTKLKKGRIKQF